MSSHLLQKSKESISGSSPPQHVWVLAYEASEWPNGAPLADKRYGTLGVYNSLRFAQQKGLQWLNERRDQRWKGQPGDHVIAKPYNTQTLLGMTAMLEDLGKLEWKMAEKYVRTCAARIGNEVLRAKIEMHEVIEAGPTEGSL